MDALHASLTAKMNDNMADIDDYTAFSPIQGPCGQGQTLAATLRTSSAPLAKLSGWERMVSVVYYHWV